jgi:hypothetical protein
MSTYRKFANENGEVFFEGAEYALIEKPTHTNRMFPGWWGDTKPGEEYVAEYSAPAIGQDGEEYVVTWRFDLINGSEPEDDGLDWDTVYSVIPA